MKNKFYYATIEEISSLIRRQEISPEAVVGACLERINEHGPKLNAFITVLGEQALAEARAAGAEIRAGKWRGPLHGIPVGIKDFYDTSGVRTSAAFEYFKGRVPQKDAAAVTKLKAAGAVIIGKMNMHTLGTGTTGLESAFGPVQNPWNPEYIPGGSSSGSAAAVASGMCYATLDTDAVGSCRLPAACCGVVGFKGTYNLVSTEGILAGEQAPDEMIVWLSHAGITTRSAADTALVLDVLAEPHGAREKGGYAASLAKDRQLRIGAANNFRADAEVVAAFEHAVEAIKKLGYAASSVAAPFFDPRQGIANIEADRRAIAAQAFKDVDVLLLPTTAATVPTVREADGNPQALSPENTAFANYYSLPAVSVPCGFDTHGLPLGLQMVGRPWDEAAVLRLAGQYQAAVGYGAEHPIP